MEQYRHHIETHFQQYVQELQAFCRQPSIANSGQGMAAMSELTYDRLSRLGSKVDTLTVNGSYPYLYTEVGQGSRSLLLYNHYDVQPVNGQPWQSPPFAAEIRQRRGADAMFARGVADNKANLLFRIQAVESYQAVYGQLPLKIKFLVEGEEEIGSPHLPQLTAAHGHRFKADGCVWESGRVDNAGRPLLYLGLKGVLYVELSAATAAADIHSALATLLPNAAWRLTQALTSLVDAEGRPAIDGLAQLLPAPTATDLALLNAIPFSTEAMREQYGINGRAPLNGAAALRRHLFEPTVNICGLAGGYNGTGVKTIIPAQARARLDLRLPPGLMPEAALHLLQAHLKRRGFEDITVTPLLSEPPAKSTADTPLVQATTAGALAGYGQPPVIWPLMAASGPMYYLCDALETPAVSFGAGHDGDNVHGPDEHIYLDNYRRALLGFGEIIRQFAGV